MIEEGSVDNRSGNAASGEFVTVVSCATESDLAQAKMILASEGIEHHVLDEFVGNNEPYLRLTGGIPARVEVPENRFDEAVDALTQAGIPADSKIQG